MLGLERMRKITTSICAKTISRSLTLLSRHKRIELSGPRQQADPYLAARVKEETKEGLVIRGCRLLATLPIADEIMVFPSTVLKNVPEDAPYAFGFAIPTNTPGLKFLVRESFDYGHSHYDHPLSSRFEELDSVVMFDDVFVPWERVMLYRDVDRCNAAYGRTGALACMAHQVAAKNLAKTEFLRWADVSAGDFHWD